VVVVVAGIGIVNVVVDRDKTDAPGFFEALAFESRSDHSQSCKPLLSGFFCRSYQGGNGLCPRPGLVLPAVVEGVLLLELWMMLD
jgi:hypothetical protein